MKPYVIGMDMGGTNLRVALGPRGKRSGIFKRCRGRPCSLGNPLPKSWRILSRTIAHSTEKGHGQRQ